MDYTGILRDRDLCREIEAKLRLRDAAAADRLAGKLKSALEHESTASGYQPAQASDEEAIVLGVGRPALFIQNGTFSIGASDIWNQRLSAAKGAIEAVIPSVGRVQLGSGAGAQMIGTGWLIAPDIIVTNRHVAESFSQAGPDGGWTFAPGNAAPTLDLTVEHEGAPSQPVSLRRVVHIEPEGAPDMALLQLANAQSSPPISLARNIFGSEDVAVIGYPAWDGQRNPGPDMKRIYGEVFEVKRLAPGFLLRVGSTSLEHDCSTLGGNSGSVVWGLQTRKALGLHYAGRFREANFAVPAPVIAAIATTQKVL